MQILPPPQATDVAQTVLGVPSLEAAFHWLVGIVGTVLSATGVWMVKTIVRHDKAIEVAQVQFAAFMQAQDTRHQENQDMLREIRDNVQDVLTHQHVADPRSTPPRR